MASATYEALDRAWKSTTRAVLGQEIGELKYFGAWLREYVESPRFEKSALSGKKVSLSFHDYCNGAEFIALDEVDFGRKFGQLNINEIKDIDSLVAAVQERMRYTGNVILGNSHFVEDSSNVTDSSFIYDTIVSTDSKYLAYCDKVKESEYEFGCYGFGESGHAIKCTEGLKSRRCFESHVIFHSSDCYYSSALRNCSEALFCFGAQNKSHIIGNLSLPKERYLGLKAKLLAEMAEKLKKDKRLFSVLEILEKAGKDGTAPAAATEKAEGFDKKVVEKAFSSTSGLLLGKQLSGIDSYSRFLGKHIPQDAAVRSAVSGKRILAASYLARLFSHYDIRKRIVDENEIIGIGGRAISDGDADKLSLDSDRLARILAPIAFTCFDTRQGSNRNTMAASMLWDSESCYVGTGYVYSRKSAFDFWAKQSEHVFGSAGAWLSSFCMKTYYSKQLTRALECDSCESSSDIYYSHNCENVHDSMFCFNVKNLRNAIGNAPLAAEKYKAVKASLVAQLAEELERKKDLKWDIYNVGCPAPKGRR
jgi:hypothetical protein